MADKDNQYRVLAQVAKGAKNLKHGVGTIDKSQLPRRSEMIREIKAEKEVQKLDGIHDAFIEDIEGGEHKQRLKKTETVDKGQRSKEQLAELIKAEEESYKQAEKDDRSKVLEDVTKEQKLKKGKTVDKSKRRKKSLIEQVKAEKEAQKQETAQQQLLADVTKGDKKLEKVETKDKSKLPSKSELAAIIKAEKEANQIDETQSKMLAAVASGAEKKKLKKTQTVDKSLAARPKEELGELIKLEKEAHKAQEKEDRSRVLDDITQGETKLKKTKTKDKSNLNKKDLNAQIKAEKEGQKHDEAQAKILADVTSGEKKLKKAETKDKTALPEKKKNWLLRLKLRNRINKKKQLMQKSWKIFLRVIIT